MLLAPTKREAVRMLTEAKEKHGDVEPSSIDKVECRRGASWWIWFWNANYPLP